MPLTPDAPNYAAQETGSLLQQSPSYTPPDMGQFTDPHQVLENQALRTSTQTQAADQSLRQRAFLLQEKEAQQNMDLQTLAHPLLAATADAKHAYLTAASGVGVMQAQQQADAFTRLPQMTQQINALDPTSDTYQQDVAGVLSQASDNPALFQALQGAAQNASAKHSAYQTSNAGSALASLQSDATNGLVPYSTYQDAKSQYQKALSGDHDFTGLFSTVRQVNTQKATAARTGFQSQLASLGEYAPALPPKLASGIYDPDEIKQFTSDVAEAQKQKNQGTTYTNLATTKGDTAMQVQELKNLGRMQYASERFGSTAAGSTAQGQLLSKTATSLISQLKTETDPGKRAQLQGQLEGVNYEMEQKAGVPLAAPSGADAEDPGVKSALGTIDNGISSINKWIALGHKDIPPGSKLPEGLNDPYYSGVLGTGVGATDTANMTPNQFRLQQLTQMRDSLVPTAAAPAAPGSPAPATSAAPITVDPNAEDNVFAPMLNSPGTPVGNGMSLTPTTDAASATAAPPASPILNPPTITPNKAATMKTGFDRRAQQTQLPSTASVAYLKAHPNLAAQFDAQYGPGSSKRVLGN